MTNFTTEICRTHFLSGSELNWKSLMFELSFAPVNVICLLKSSNLGTATCAHICICNYVNACFPANFRYWLMTVGTTFLTKPLLIHLEEGLVSDHCSRSCHSCVRARPCVRSLGWAFLRAFSRVRVLACVMIYEGYR